jgi:pimeloyl-ACP methyl ester carboxylesterase
MQTTQRSAPAGPGTANGTPGLPAGFGEVFTSRWVTVGELRLHAVVGGDGPPLLLIPGWPQTWYAWRLLMPALARDFTVVAADPRGTGLSGKPGDGYDTATLAADLTGLMEALGHERFAVAGHDVGMWIGYAMAADHPGRVERLVLAEALIPGLSSSPPLFAPRDVVERLWHFAFNQLDDLNEQLVSGREDVFLRWQFTHKTARPLSEPAIEHYVDSLRRDPPGAAHQLRLLPRDRRHRRAERRTREEPPRSADPDHRRRTLDRSAGRADDAPGRHGRPRRRAARLRPLSCRRSTRGDARGPE